MTWVFCALTSSVVKRLAHFWWITCECCCPVEPHLLRLCHGHDSPFVVGHQYTCFTHFFGYSNVLYRNRLHVTICAVETTDHFWLGLLVPTLVCVWTNSSVCVCVCVRSIWQLVWSSCKGIHVCLAKSTYAKAFDGHWSDTYLFLLPATHVLSALIFQVWKTTDWHFLVF